MSQIKGFTAGSRKDQPVKAGWCLRSRGSQLGPAEEFGTVSALTLPESAGSSAPWLPDEMSESLMLVLSSSEELDILSIDAGDIEDSPPLSPAYEELLEVVTHAVNMLNVDWPVEKQSASCKPEHNLHVGPAFFFFFDLHTEISELWKRPFSSHISSPTVSNYSLFLGLKENVYGMMPRVEETLASYLSPNNPLLASLATRSAWSLRGSRRLSDSGGLEFFCLSHLKEPGDRSSTLTQSL